MDSPVLERLESGPLTFEDLFQEPSQQDKCMDVDQSLAVASDLFKLDDATLFLQPRAFAIGPDRDELLRAALRSHEDGVTMPVPTTAAQLNAGAPLAVLQQLDNNAVNASASSVSSAVASGRPAPVVKSVATRAVVVVKPDPGSSTPKQQHQHVSNQQQQQPSTSEQQLSVESDTDDMAGQDNKAGVTKRRRRIRNAKQQELNRLAQQRYRERKKQKYSNLQGTVDELSMRLHQLNTLEAANSELVQRNHQLETVVKEQQSQLQNQRDTIAKHAQQLSTQAHQLATQAQQLKQQVQRIEQQDRQVTELRSKLAAASQPVPASTTVAGGIAAEDQQLNDQLALAVRAVLTGVSSMASVLPAKDAQQMQLMVSQLPDALLQQIRSCCREVALHLKNTEVKEQPHAIQVPCC
eukprot:gene3179-3457_t